MKKTSTPAPYELEVLAAYEQGKPKSIATKAELAKRMSAARATAIKDKRVNIRLSSADLNDIHVRAPEEGMPYQMLIASVLHKSLASWLSQSRTVQPVDDCRQLPAHCPAAPWKWRWPMAANGWWTIAPSPSKPTSWQNGRISSMIYCSVLTAQPFEDQKLAAITEDYAAILSCYNAALLPQKL